MEDVFACGAPPKDGRVWHKLPLINLFEEPDTELTEADLPDVWVVSEQMKDRDWRETDPAKAVTSCVVWLAQSRVDSDRQNESLTRSLKGPTTKTVGRLKVF